MKATFLLLAIITLSQIALVNGSVEVPQLQWSKTYGLYNGLSIIQTADHGYIIAGDNQTGYYPDPSFNPFLVKVDELGQVQWIKSFGDEFLGIHDRLSVVQTSDLGYVLAVPSHWLLKLDSQGRIEWNQTILSLGGVVIQTSDGGFLVSGIVLTEYFGNRAAEVTKVSSTGNLLWNKTFVGVSGDVTFNALAEANGNEYALAGNWGTQSWFGTIDASGNLLVNKTYRFYSRDGDAFYGMSKTIDGGYILSGSHLSENSYLCKIDSRGNVEWNNSYYPRVLLSVAQSANGDYVAGGWAGEPATHGSTVSGYVIKTNSSGYMEWLGNYGVVAESVITTADNGFAVTGTANGGLWLAKFLLNSPSIPEFQRFEILTLIVAATASALFCCTFRKCRYRTTFEA